MLKSSLTGKYYDEKDSIRLVNPRQSAFYWSRGVAPISVYPSKDLNTGDPIIVFIFSKEKTKDLYQEWLEKRPNNKND